ncbi:hypothetical protein TcCL_Unassigned05440 [Trypanosoma cruzi]|nr:hypothetical protein TcCL_Unassigned05440 [Trypanosoma cruzi]
MQGEIHTEREKEECVCGRCTALSLTLTRPPPQQQQQEEEAKEGRWCGRPRCCCHCRHEKLCHLFWLWRLLLLLGFLHSERQPSPRCLMLLQKRNSYCALRFFHWRVFSSHFWPDCLLCHRQTAGP